MLRKFLLGASLLISVSAPSFAKENLDCSILVQALNAVKEDVAKDPSVEVCLKNVPLEYLMHPQFFDWARDPDQSDEGEKGRLSKQSIREAMGAIDLVRSGQVVGPILRGERAKYADFVDGNGNGFDIKAYSSPREIKGEELDTNRVLKEVLKKLNRPFRNTLTNQPSSIRVYMDLTWINTVDRQRVKKALESTLTPDLLERVSYFELLEPQVKFQARNSIDSR